MSPGQIGKTDYRIGDAQAAGDAAGGGRVNRAKVERAVARAHIGSISTAVTTGETGAGARLGVSWTLMCAATQSEQSVCVAIWSACVWATCTTPANTTKTAQRTATATLQE